MDASIAEPFVNAVVIVVLGVVVVSWCEWMDRKQRQKDERIRKASMVVRRKVWNEGKWEYVSNDLD